MTMASMKASLGRFFADRNHWLIGAFGSFIILIVTFALLYYSAYRSDRSNFLFAADIARGQVHTFTSEANSKLPMLSRSAIAVKQAISSLRTDRSTPGKTEPIRIHKKWPVRCSWSQIARRRTLDQSVSGGFTRSHSSFVGPGPFYFAG